MANLAVKTNVSNPVNVTPKVLTEKPAAQSTKPETPQIVKDSQKDHLQVSPIITIPGSALVAGATGAATGAAIVGSLDLFAKGGAFKEALAAGGLIGGATGVVTGSVIAHMAKNKTQAILYSALAGFGTGAVIGGVKIKSLPAALTMGAVGAVSGAISGGVTAHLLRK